MIRATIQAGLVVIRVIDMYSLLRRALFTLDAEVAHERTATLLKFASQTPGASAVLRQLFAPATRGLGQTVAGLTFAHPIGLAAGFDKHADLTHGMALLGFSHVEVGTVTPRPQAGNPKPRMFRLVEDHAIINRMGFNSVGMDVVAPRMAKRPLQLPVGINIGKNRDTALADATADYLSAFTTLAPHADYVAVNISSPNTPGLRQLHETAALRELLDALRAANQWQRPIFLKISPDESLDQLEQVIATAMTAGISGIIATNTTISRPNLQSTNANEVGGLSGVPLRDPAMATLRHVARLTNGRLPIVSVGGISSAQDVYARLRAGASLVQLYTALVYQGPAIVAQLSWGLAALLRRDGVSDIRQIIGVDCNLPA
jgi:dihydroorotate dehydrogenase